MLGAALLLAGIYLANLIAVDSGYNKALARADFATAAQHQSDYGKFAKARQQQISGDLGAAHNTFSSIDLQQRQNLRVPVLFYLAENYVEQAVKFEQKDDDEQRIPLLELAKENYRKILTVEPDNWSVRVNLAQVLSMLPDARLSESEDEDIMPERSPQAPVQTLGYDRLP